MDIKNVSLMPSNKTIASKEKETLTNQNKDFSEILNNKIEKDPELMEACQMLESFFIKEILKSADSVSFSEEGGLFEKSEAEKTFKDMLNDEYSQTMSKGQGMGIAEMLYKQLK